MGKPHLYTVNKTRKKKIEWSEEEDATLKRLVNDQLRTEAVTTNKWSKISDAMPGRSGKQCRERWVNKLDPALSWVDWSEGEDAILLILGYDYPNQWARISEALPGRSAKQVRAHWRSLQNTFNKQEIQSGIEAAARDESVNSDRCQLHFY